MDNNEDMSLDEAIAAAMDEHETEEVVEDAVSGETDAPEEEVQAEAADEPEFADDGEAVEAEVAQEAAGDLDTPPSSLSPAAREAWKDTPQAIREAIAKRETDMQAGVDKIKPEAERAKAMDEVLSPYQQLFNANGGNATQTIQQGLNIMATLQMGDKNTAAQMVAQAINQFGVPLESINQFLGGEQPQAQAQPQLAPQDVQQIVQQQFQQYQQHQGQAQATSEVQSFSEDKGNEFYNDVKMDMADILEMSANRGEPLTMQQAYDRACQMNPEIQSIMLARQSAPSPAQRRAASTVSGGMAGQVVANAPESIEDYLNAAIDAHGGMP